MSNFIYINKYTGVLFNTITNPIGVEAIKREDTQKSYILTHGTITGGTSASLELENTNADYQTTLAAKVILIITGSGSTLTDFEIIEDTTVNAGTGTQLEDFPSVSLTSTQYITSKVLSVAANKYVTVKSTTGNISAVTAILIE